MHSAILDDLPATPQTQFRLYFYAAFIEALQQAVARSGSLEVLLERCPAAAAYLGELADRGLEGGTLEAAALWWREAVQSWESNVESRLPLRELARSAELDYWSIVLWIGTGLMQEDVHLAALFEEVAPLAGRVNAASLSEWCEDFEPSEVRERLRHLAQLGLLEVSNADAGFAHRVLSPVTLLWSAARSGVLQPDAAWLRIRSTDHCAPLDTLCLSAEKRRECERVGALLAGHHVDTVIVRGPHGNGRRSLVGALAHAMGKGIIEIDLRTQEQAVNARIAGPLAVLLNAVPMFIFDLPPGETMALPTLGCDCSALGVVLGLRGALSGLSERRAVTIELPLPDVATRRELWRRELVDADQAEIEPFSEAYRMTSGNLRQMCALARARALVQGRPSPLLEDIREAARSLDRSALDTLAALVSGPGDWNDLIIDAESKRELSTLATRCRYREQLRSMLNSVQGNCGVRALLRGPSGTGKTLAARVLASVLGKDLYRIDLSTVVNKYIGETEKNLDRAFTCAESLDVVLLLDEGDALLGHRTGVNSANDRYANLETSFLLQRIEAYEGILFITTNLADQIDSAFHRRIDVVVDFRLPDAEQRLAIFNLHLPPAHRVGAHLVEEVASRCSLSGGQIRNVVLHASLLALEEHSVPDDHHLEIAVHREYRKAGTMCPLRPAARLVSAVS